MTQKSLGPVRTSLSEVLFFRSEDLWGLKLIHFELKTLNSRRTISLL